MTRRFQGIPTTPLDKEIDRTLRQVQRSFEHQTGEEEIFLDSALSLDIQCSIELQNFVS